MEWVWKTLLTAGSVMLVMLRPATADAAPPAWWPRCPRLPRPRWLCWRMIAVPFAADAAVASLAACAMLAAFAVVHATWRVATAWRRRWPAARVAAALLAAPTALASATLVAALALAVFSCVLALLCLPSAPSHALPPVRAPIVATALAAAGLALVTAALAPLVGIFAAGLLASLPLVSGAVAVSEQASAGYPGVAQFLRGYVRGLPARAVFCVVFAMLAVPLGWIAAGAMAAILSSAVGLLLQRTPSASASGGSFDIRLRAESRGGVSSCPHLSLPCTKSRDTGWSMCMGEVTLLIAQARDGDRAAFDRIFELMYPELRRRRAPPARRATRATARSTPRRSSTSAT